MIQSATILHDCEDEVTVAALCFSLQRKSGRIGHRIILAVPVFDESRDTTTERVAHLSAHLSWIARRISHVHVARLTEPSHEMGVDPGGCARIKQRSRVYFADVRQSGIAVRLRSKGYRGTRIACSLSG